MSYAHHMHAAPGKSQRRLIAALAAYQGPRKRVSGWAPLARAAWEAGVPESEICDAIGRDLMRVRQVIADSIAEEQTLRDELSGR